MQCKASAPGSLMLLGEYAVLYGKHALVCAVDKRIHVVLTPRDDDFIRIQSSVLGCYQTRLADLQIEKPFHFILGVFKLYETRLRHGYDIDVVSEFSDKVGLGSSAAVTVATLAALVTSLNIRITPLELVRQGRNVVRKIQGLGSGADIAASVYGGVVGYQAQPLSAEKYAVTCPLTALYAGYKTPTVEAVMRVQNSFGAHPTIFRSLSSSIGQCAVDGLQYARKEDWDRLGEVMNIQQGIMESLGVNTPLLREMIEDLRKQPGVYGAKISGSGLGDCVIALGELPESYQFAGSHVGVQRIPIKMTLQGVQCEKI